MTNINPQFNEQCSLMPLNAKYTSPEVQNELINIAILLAECQIREAIRSVAVDAIVRGLMGDESKDISGKEQISICIRYARFPSLAIQEQFLMFDEYGASFVWIYLIAKLGRFSVFSFSLMLLCFLFVFFLNVS
jgi:hypothetical protein